MAAPGAQGSKNGPRAVFGSQEAVLQPFSSTLYSALLLFKRHLTIRVNPQQVNLLKNPLKSLHIDETIVGLSLALLPRARPRAKPQPRLNYLGYSVMFNYLITLFRRRQFKRGCTAYRASTRTPKNSTSVSSIKA